MWNLIISTIVFFVAARYLRRYLDEQGLPKGVTRGALVLAVATLVSCAAGDVVNWTQEKVEGTHAADDTSVDVTQLLKDLGQPQP